MSKKTIERFFVIFLLLAAPVYAQSNAEESLDTLLKKYISLPRVPCGQRDEDIRLGQRILELHADDKLNAEVIAYLKQQTEKIRKEDPICVRNILYNKLYKDKYWQPFFELSKHIIAEEGEKPLALDVMLTLVSVGYDRAAVDKVDTFNADTINYAEQAIQRLESGAASQTGNYGAFLPYKTKEFPDSKTNALSWMNYIIGWINHHRLNKKAEALGYFYKAAQFNGDLRKNGDVYQLIGRYYYDEIAILTGKTNEPEDEKLSALQKAYAERALIAFAKTYKTAVDSKSPKKRIDAIYQNIAGLYRFRFNLPAEESAGLDQFILMLIDRPLPDHNAPPTPVFEEPFELKIKRNKVQ